jgi:hypothetical protein
MTPRHAVLLLGLCNLVAGALVAWAPALLMPGADGLGSTATRLCAGSLGIMLAGAGIGGLLMPDPAVRTYLWVFGVSVKVAATLAWATIAVQSGIAMLWAGAALDLAVAMAIAATLIRR